MFNKHTAYISLMLFLFMVCPRPAHSVENLNFNTQLPPTSKLHVLDFLKKEYEEDLKNYEAATIDLNADGMDEIILKKQGCEDKKILCRYLILAVKKEKVILLSGIKARYIMAGGTYSHGILDILAFKNRINDYDFDIYIWDSKRAQYTMKEREGS